jgi:hypothetical protein
MSITKTPAQAGQVRKAGQLVDSKHVDSLLSNYKKERWVSNSKKLGKEDSLSVWYGMNELNEFMQIARENGADGIRMYFGVYPEGFEKVPEYSGRQTIVMVATKAKRTEDGRLVTKHIYYQTEKGTELLAFNLSYVCPPICAPDDTMGDGVFIIQDQGLGLTMVKNDEGNTIVL